MLHLHVHLIRAVTIFDQFCALELKYLVQRHFILLEYSLHALLLSVHMDTFSRFPHYSIFKAFRKKDFRQGYLLLKIIVTVIFFAGTFCVDLDTWSLLSLSVLKVGGHQCRVKSKVVEATAHISNTLLGFLILVQLKEELEPELRVIGGLKCNRG